MALNRESGDMNMILIVVASQRHRYARNFGMGTAETQIPVTCGEAVWVAQEGECERQLRRWFLQCR